MPLDHFCDDVLETVEGIAAGELVTDARVESHLATCAGCAQALAEARRLEALLRQREVPAAPQQFTARTLGRIRRDRWRREQFFDAAFNAIVAIFVVGGAVAVSLALSRSGVGSTGPIAWNFVNDQVAAFLDRIGPSVPLYAGAAALLGMALGIWWWAERGASA
jgi:predicted anti-sigma-YlaC factor YlaD